MCINYKVPFYSNTPDDTHCFQASLRMVLKYFEPEKEFTWEELEKITAKVDGLWTWATAGVLWMQENGYDVKNIESFDYEKFIKERELYLLEIFGNEMGKAQIEHSDVDQECKLAKRYIKEVDLENRIPCVDDIDNLLNDGYLIICNVNSVALNNEKGYAGHSVVIKGIFEDKIILHDPGLPALENRVVTFEQFEKAWAYPDEKSKNITAFKLKK